MTRAKTTVIGGAVGQECLRKTWPEKRSKRIVVPFTPTEAKQLDRIARYEHTTWTDIIRTAVIKKIFERG